MRVVVNSTDAVMGLGDDSLIAGDGQQVRESALTVAAFQAAEAAVAALGGPGEVWHDAASDTFKARTRSLTTKETTRALVLQTAQSAVGVNIVDLTAAQIKALVACLLYDAGALNASGVVQPLAGWLR